MLAKERRVNAGRERERQVTGIKRGDMSSRRERIEKEKENCSYRIVPTFPCVEKAQNLFRVY